MTKPLLASLSGERQETTNVLFLDGALEDGGRLLCKYC